jgi:hypothetical protein
LAQNVPGLSRAIGEGQEIQCKILAAETKEVADESGIE